MPGSHGRELVKLDTRLAELGERYTEREVKHREALAKARECAEDLHRQVADGLASFHGALGEVAPHLRVSLSEPRVDDKHIHSDPSQLLKTLRELLQTSIIRTKPFANKFSYCLHGLEIP